MKPTTLYTKVHGVELSPKPPPNINTDQPVRPYAERYDSTYTGFPWSISQMDSSQSFGQLVHRVLATLSGKIVSQHCIGSGEVTTDQAMATELSLTTTGQPAVCPVGNLSLLALVTYLCIMWERLVHEMYRHN